MSWLILLHERFVPPLPGVVYATSPSIWPPDPKFFPLVWPDATPQRRDAATRNVVLMKDGGADADA